MPKGGQQSRRRGLADRHQIASGNDLLRHIQGPVACWNQQTPEPPWTSDLTPGRSKDAAHSCLAATPRPRDSGHGAKGVRAEVPHPGAEMIVASQRYSTLNIALERPDAAPPLAVARSCFYSCPPPLSLPPCTRSAYHSQQRPSGTSDPPHSTGVCPSGRSPSRQLSRFLISKNATQLPGTAHLKHEDHTPEGVNSSPSTRINGATGQARVREQGTPPYHFGHPCFGAVLFYLEGGEEAVTLQSSNVVGLAQ